MDQPMNSEDLSRALSIFEPAVHEIQLISAQFTEALEELRAIRALLSPPPPPPLKRLNIEIQAGNWVEADDGTYYRDAVVLLGDAGFCRFAPSLDGDGRDGRIVTKGTVLAFLFMADDEHPPAHPPIERLRMKANRAFGPSTCDFSAAKVLAAGMVEVPGVDIDEDDEDDSSRFAPAWVFSFDIVHPMPVPDLSTGTSRYPGRDSGVFWKISGRGPLPSNSIEPTLGDGGGQR